MQAARGTPLNDPPSAPSSTPDRTPAPRRVRLFAKWALLVFVLDVISKVIAVQLLPGAEPVRLLGGLLTLRLTRNPGAAFSLGTQYTVLLTAVAIGVAVLVLRLSYRLGSAGWASALGLLLGGACGNLADRLLRYPGPLRGYVIDFLELPHWPVFNLADTAIVCGAFLVVVQSMRGVRLDGSRG
jgi:signal peptidase II